MITSDGQWKVGDTAQDLAQFLREEGAEGYDVDEVRHSVCARCGKDVFEVHFLIEEQAVKRICQGCGAERFVADSGDHWHDDYAISGCVCDGDDGANLAVGYSLYGDREGVRALAVASRCTECGRLGYVTEWMVRSGDPDLLEKA